MNIERDKFYRTRDGHKMRVVCVDAPGNYPVIAISDHEGFASLTFTAEGKNRRIHNSDCDLIAPWIEKPEVDWSVLPAWHDSAAYSSSRDVWYSGVNVRMSVTGVYWVWDEAITIPPAYAPKWTGDWKDSLVTREVAK